MLFLVGTDQADPARQPIFEGGTPPPYYRVSELGRIVEEGDSDDPWRLRLARELLAGRSEEHTSELQSRRDLVCRLLLEKKKPDKRLRRRARGESAGRNSHPHCPAQTDHGGGDHPSTSWVTSRGSLPARHFAAEQ